MLRSIKRVCLYRYDLPLFTPISVKGSNLHHREGLLLHIEFSDGQDGWGEIAPLPGFSQESLQEAEKALSQHLSSLEHGRDLYNEAAVDALPASVAFGLSSALSDLFLPALTSDDSAFTPYSLSFPKPYPLVSLDKLLTFIENRPVAAQQSIKIKVNPRSLGQAIELINKSVEQLGTKFPGFRIDANRSLDYTQALQLVEAIPASAVYYLEEPLRDPSGLATLYAETGVAIALDESLQLASLLPGFEELKGIAAYVIKPMLCGSLDRLSQLAGLAKKHNIELIISSVYEGALGWSQLCGLAQHYAQGKPAGLDTRGPFGDQHTGLIQPGTFTTTLRERYYPGSQQVGEWRWTGA